MRSWLIGVMLCCAPLSSACAGEQVFGCQIHDGDDLERHRDVVTCFWETILANTPDSVADVRSQNLRLRADIDALMSGDRADRFASADGLEFIREWEKQQARCKSISLASDDPDSVYSLCNRLIDFVALTFAYAVWSGSDELLSDVASSRLVPEPPGISEQRPER